MTNQNNKLLNFDEFVKKQLGIIESHYKSIAGEYGGDEECIKFSLEFEEVDIRQLDENSRIKISIGNCLAYIFELKNDFDVKDGIGWILNEIYELGMTYGFVAEFTTGKLGRASLMREYAKKRLEKDPIQLAKKEIENDYEVVKSQFKRRGYSAQFIRDMKVKHSIIVDIKTIERLVAQLNKKMN